MDLNLEKIKNVHFIGIGGIGISAVARMMYFEGKNVTGQDMQEGEIVEEIKKLGIDVKIGQSYENIPKEANLIVYTVAIETYDKPLFDKLKKEDADRICSYPEMLGIISQDKYTIAICGTHGKTTTTGMIAEIFKNANMDPTVIVGSLLKDKDDNRTNFIHGDPNRTDGREYFIVEACEYRRSFLHINPNILVITNVDADHLDYYKDIEDIKKAFNDMVMKVPDDGYIICNPNDPNIKDVLVGAKGQIINYEAYFDNNLKLKIPGLHNRKNAGASIATAVVCDIDQNKARDYVRYFSGTWKRFEYREKLINGVLLYDDYAHHPKEITSTLDGFRELYPKNQGWKINVIFQPHLFSRTKLLKDDFAKSFFEADFVLLLPIYYAREVDDGSISSEILNSEINKYSHNSKSYNSFSQLEKFLEVRLPEMTEKDIIVTMGAGEASKIGDFLIKNYKKVV
jgi:UDP-N-acetylmuramate--alanine ligase